MINYGCYDKRGMTLQKMLIKMTRGGDTEIKTKSLINEKCNVSML